MKRSEILDAVWPDLDTQETVLATCIAELRQALGDNRERPRYIETLYGRGFRFVAPVLTSDHSESPPIVPTSSDQVADQARIIGRDAVLGEIATIVEQVRGGGSHAILVSGPAGIGKTRLLAEVVTRMRPRGVRVIEVDTIDREQQAEFALWKDVVEALADHMATAELQAALGWGAEDVAMIAPAIMLRLSLNPAARVLEPSVARARFFSAITAFLKNCVSERPLALVFDDLHKATAGSLALIESVLRSCEERPLLLVMAFRDADARGNPILGSLLDSWQANSRVTTLRLTGLQADAVRDLISSACDSPLSEKELAQVAGAADGNPFSVLQLAATIRDLSKGDAPAAADVIPHTVAWAIESRLRNLSPPVQELLAVAAIAGDAFDARIIARAAAIQRTALTHLIGEALHAGFLVELDGDAGRLRFRHDLLREAVLQPIAASERSELHLCIGEALEELSGTGDAVIPQLAYHFSEAARDGKSRKAVSYCLRAGVLALEAYAHERAEELIERAASLANTSPDVDGDTTRSILEQLAEVRVRLGRFDEGAALANDLYALAKAKDQPEWIATAAIIGARANFPFRPKIGTQAIQSLEGAWQALDSRPTLKRGLVAARMACALLAQHDNGKRLTMAHEAVAIARQLPDSIERMRVLHESMLAFWDADHLEDRIALTNEFEHACAAAGDNQLQGAIDGWKTLNLLARGEIRELEKVLAHSSEPFRDLPNHGGRRYAARLRIAMAGLHGQLDKMREGITELSTLYDPADPLLGRVEVLFANIQLKRLIGDLSDTTPLMKMMIDQYPMLPLRFLLPLLLWQGGHREEARADLSFVARNQFRDLPPRNEALGWLGTVVTLAEASAFMRDRGNATILYDLLKPFAQQWVVVHLGYAVLGPVERVLGRLADTMDLEDLSRQHFEAVLHTTEKEGALGELARAQIDFAQMLSRRNPRSSEARRLRQAAFHIADTFGLEGLCRRAELLTQE